jgi:molybdopterin synthase sulfur carrier subunit
MSVEILFFGQLTDKTGCSTLHLDNPGSIAALKSELFEKFPSLKDAKFTIALNNKLALENELIIENTKIALMPPFSGG